MTLINPEIERWNREHPEAPTTIERSYTDLKKTETDQRVWVTRSGRRKTAKREAQLSISDRDKTLAQSSARQVYIQPDDDSGSCLLDLYIGGDGAGPMLSSGFLPGDSQKDHNPARQDIPWWLLRKDGLHQLWLQAFFLFETGPKWKRAASVLLGYYRLNESDLELWIKHQHSKTIAGAKRYRERLVAAGNEFFERLRAQ